MSLLGRMIGTELPKIPVHQFWASLSELTDGKLTAAQVKTAFEIVDGTDLSEWNWLVTKYQASVDKKKFTETLHAIFMLAEYKLYGYDVKATLSTRISEIG